MQVSAFRPHPEFTPYIPVIWLFESETGIPTEDSRIIVPNGNAKILIPYKNTLSVTSEVLSLTTSESDVLLTGLQQYPLKISSTSLPTATIGVEITPKGLCHLFSMQMSTVTNGALKLSEAFSAWGKALEAQLRQAKEAAEKIEILQAALIQNLDASTRDLSLLDFVIDMITNSEGLITIQDIETTSGYSKRYLDFLFQRHVGISPKALAGILRFQKFYKEWAAQPSPDFFKADLHAHYYDQSHFIREFRRFSGMTPGDLRRMR